MTGAGYTGGYRKTKGGRMFDAEFGFYRSPPVGGGSETRFIAWAAHGEVRFEFLTRAQAFGAYKLLEYGVAYHEVCELVEHYVHRDDENLVWDMLNDLVAGKYVFRQFQAGDHVTYKGERGIVLAGGPHQFQVHMVTGLDRGNDLLLPCAYLHPRWTFKSPDVAKAEAPR